MTNIIKQELEDYYFQNPQTFIRKPGETMKENILESLRKKF